jgi:uncharacterized membrane protein YvlD (DUF360 family)
MFHYIFFKIKINLKSFSLFIKRKMRKGAYVLMLAAYITASVLIFESKERVDNTMKPILEGLTVGLTILTLGGLAILFRENTVKNALLFQLVNVLLCALSVVTLITCLRDSGFDKQYSVNVGFISLLAVSVGITGFLVLDDTMNAGATLGKKLSKKK